MLRPACLLPATQLLLLRRLLTPRSGKEVSLNYLGSATRRTDALRDGTFTRWSGAAGQGTPSPIGDQLFLRFTTHHHRILAIRYMSTRQLHAGAFQRRSERRATEVAMLADARGADRILRHRRLRRMAHDDAELSAARSQPSIKVP